MAATSGRLASVGGVKFRGALLLLFLLPLAWGLINLLRGAADPGAPRCPGVALDEVGEEHPGRMRPSHTCRLFDDSTRPTGTRTYEEQRNAQVEQREDHFKAGLAYTVYGVAGVGVVVAAGGPYRLRWRRGPVRKS
ncbi:Transmembrane protein OS=Streptomyces aurantiogriseus OX=66870 GN=GCM10010251_70040 PE=4 SV=1 [Streptomyces aurantiogriseus]